MCLGIHMCVLFVCVSVCVWCLQNGVSRQQAAPRVSWGVGVWAAVIKSACKSVCLIFVAPCFLDSFYLLSIMMSYTLWMCLSQGAPVKFMSRSTQLAAWSTSADTDPKYLLSIAAIEFKCCYCCWLTFMAMETLQTETQIATKIETERERQRQRWRATAAVDVKFYLRRVWIIPWVVLSFNLSSLSLFAESLVRRWTPGARRSYL